MKRVVRILLYFIAALVVFVLVAGIWNYRTIENVPRLVSAFHAKEMCSCYFVVKQTESYCHDYAAQVSGISNVTLDQEKKEIRVSTFGSSSLAKYHDERTGCRLEQTK